MSTNRVSWIDLAKSISLVGVIVIHCLDLSNQLAASLTGFVLPAFFILAGIAHKNEKHRFKIQNLIRSRFISLMIPYFILSIVMVAIYASLYPSVDVGLAPSEFAFWTVYGNGPIQRVSHLWYLRALFFAIILFAIFDRYLHDKHQAFRVLIALALPGIGVMMRSAAGVELLPWGIDSTLVGLSFVIIGNEIRRVQGLSSWSISGPFDTVAVVLSFMFFALLTLINGYVNIGISIYGLSVYIYLLTGFLGTYIVSIISFHA
ncbi:MAG: acyltransferase family protein, partial [Candidatus Thorarchaeota archaeon]